MSDLIRRDDVDPRNLANPRKLDGVPYTDYERGYNDGVIDAYWLTRNAKAVEAEPVVRCKECKSRVHDVSADEYWCLNPGGLSCRLKDDYFCPFGSRR